MIPLALIFLFTAENFGNRSENWQSGEPIMNKTASKKKELSKRSKQGWK